MSPRTRFPFLLFTLLLAALLLAGSALTVRAAVQTFPAWSFKPISSAVPANLVDPYVVEIGEQRELLIDHLTGAVRSYALVIGSVATPILTIGDDAPGGGTFTDVNGLTAYIASPTLVYITASVNAGGSDVTRHFRWSNSTLEHLPVDAGVFYDLERHDAHGRFLARRAVDDTHTEYWITDGLFNSDPITLVNQLPNDDPKTEQQVIGITAAGAFLIHESIIAGTVECTLAPSSPENPTVPTEQTSDTRLFWLGSRSGNIAFGSFATSGCAGNGLAIHGAVLNSAGDVLSHEAMFAGGGGVYVSILTKLWLYPADGSGAELVAQGEQINDVGPYFFMQPQAITEWRQPIFKAAADAQNNTSRLYSGPNPAADGFDGNFTQGFGQDGTPLELYNFSENGDALVYAELADHSFDYALAHSGALEWVKATGGNWSEATNWDPVQVPGQNDETIFRLEASYDVNVGTRDVGRVRIENGSVAFTDADLTLLGPLTVGGDATFTLPEGTLETSELIIGSLAPTDPLNPPTAHVFVSNQGTTITGTTVIAIGHASPGDLFLSDAHIIGGPLTIGENFPGSAVVSGQHSLWTTTGALAVGYGYTGTLIIEHGGEMRSFGEVVIGYGTTLQDYTATVDVSNQGAPALGLGNWLITDLFTLGNNLRGELYISNGGSVYITEGVLQAGLQAHGTSFDAFMDVDGSSDTAGITSTLGTFGDVLLGMADGADVGVNISRGGEMFIAGGNLYLAHESGSEATLTVAGINDHGDRAHLEVTGETGSFETGICSVGENGQASLLVRQGGMVECKTIRIGALPGSNGYVLVDGQNGGSTLYSESSLCIGSDPLGLCNGAASGQQGTLELRNGGNAVAERATVIGTGGRLTGSGTLIAGELGLAVFDGGVIEPGVTVLQSANISPFAVAAIETGTLTISGSVTISPTAQITLDVLGLTHHDRLIVHGDVNLAGGTLTLAFGNGYLPQQGDTFEFFSAESITGNFSDVKTTGLPAGYIFDVTIVGGQVVVEVTEDGGAASGYPVYLPLVVR